MKYLKQLWLRYLTRVQIRARAKSLKAAIKGAQEETERTGKKTLVYFLEGEYTWVTKQDMKNKWKELHGKTMTLQEAEQLSKAIITKLNKHGKGKQTKAERQKAFA